MTFYQAVIAVPDPRFHDISPPISFSEISEGVGIHLPDGSDPARLFSGVAPLSDAGPDEISFLANPKYVDQLRATKAGAVLVAERSASRVPEGCIAWVVGNPYLIFSKVSCLFHPLPKVVPGIHPKSIVDPTAVVGEGVRIDPGAVIGENVVLGDRVWIASNVVIERGCTIGADTRIGANVSIAYADIGSNCRIGPGSSIGTRGFGVAMDGAGHVELPQVGAVRIGDDVELGGNCCVDRGMGKDTVIGDGTKLDNMVQVGHAAQIGKHCVLAGQSGVAGSAVLEDFVVSGAQVGVGGHITMGKGTQIAGKTGVMKSTEPGAQIAGYPAQPIKQWLRAHHILNSLAAKKSGQ